MTTAEPQGTKRNRRAARLLAVCLLLAGVAVVVTLAVRRPDAPHAQRPATDVPLGVEEAVIIRYRGPRLVARPYRRGASVNLRIAGERPSGDARVYDVRYVVSLPGEFDVTDYLTSADGGSIDDLPSFTVRGLTSLTKDIETRIQEIEKVQIHIWHGYYETLAGLGVLWVLWLIGLIFVGRPRRVRELAPAPPAPSIETRIRRYLDTLGARELTLDEKTQLEALLLLHWRSRLGFDRCRLAPSCRRIQRSRRFGRAYEELQAWLHDPRADIRPADFLKTCPLSPDDGSPGAGRAATS